MNGPTLAGPVVLRLLRAEVAPQGWLTNDQFLAGYGAARALPGPMFAFSAYHGAAMRPGWNAPPWIVVIGMAAVAIGPCIEPACDAPRVEPPRATRHVPAPHGQRSSNEPSRSASLLIRRSSWLRT